MEEILIAILKGGELLADIYASVYERVAGDEEDAAENGQEEPD